jgi:hypothetical protein
LWAFGSTTDFQVANLAVVFAPSLFFVQGSTGDKIMREVQLQVQAASCMKLLITHQDKLWNVPVDTMAQLR